MIWNKLDQLIPILNKYIDKNTFSSFVYRLGEYKDDYDKIINLELLKQIKKAIPQLNLSNPIEWTEKLNNLISKLK